MNQRASYVKNHEGRPRARWIAYGGPVTEPAELELSLLVIEDDPRLAQLTARNLKSHGISVVVCHDGSKVKPKRRAVPTTVSCWT